jgi:hypothetical protein
MHTTGQWPDNICKGFIRYTPSTLPFKGFTLRDASHGIPVFGSVTVETFNYPGQTEAITRRLVAAWNASVGIPLDELERKAASLAGEN